MENKKVLNVDDLVKRAKKYIAIGNTGIKIRNFVNIKAWEEYNKGFKETEDYRIAFIKMLLSMTEVNKAENKNNISYIELEQISDDELVKVMDEITHTEKYIEEYFSINSCPFTYENFYNAYKYQNKKLAEMIQESLSPLINVLTDYGKQARELVANNIALKNLFTIPKINIPSFNYPQLNDIFKPITSLNADYVEQYDLDSEILTSHSQEDVIDEIISANQNEQKNTEILSGILSIIKEGQKSQKKSERSSRRLAICTITIAVFSLVIAAMSFLGLDNLNNVFKKVFGI